MKEEDYKVTVNGAGISCKRPDGHDENVSWSHLEMITIETAAPDSEQPDIVWILWGLDKKSGVLFPGGATGAGAAVSALQSKLRSFKTEVIADAMAATENNTYLVWQKPNPKAQ